MFSSKVMMLLNLMFRFCASHMTLTSPVRSRRVMATKGWFFAQSKDLCLAVNFHSFSSHLDYWIKSYNLSKCLHCFFANAHTFSYELFSCSTSCSRCTCFQSLVGFSVACLYCPCQMLRFLLICALISLRFVFGLIERCPSVSADVHSPALLSLQSNFFSSLLLHSSEAIHDVPFNWFFPNKLELIV